MKPADDYFSKLREKYAAVWGQVPSAMKLQKRLLLDGERSLRDVFLASHAVSGSGVSFKESDPSCEFAFLEAKLEDALELLAPKAEDKTENQKSESSQPAAKSEATAGDAKPSNPEPQGAAQPQQSHSSQGHQSAEEAKDAALHADIQVGASEECDGACKLDAS
jgi:hypothetical protein